MTIQMQGGSLPKFAPLRLATRSCNNMWDHAPMTDEEKAREAAALAELDELTAAFKETGEAHERARDALHEAIVRHLRERNAPPSMVAKHSPYDRNHVGRIAKAAGVPPLRERTVRSVKAKE